MTLNEKIAVMQAYADGSEIEMRNKMVSGADWVRADGPGWDWLSYDYRVRSDRVPDLHKITLLRTKSTARVDALLDALRASGVVDGTDVCLGVDDWYLVTVTMDWNQ